ncbi:MAG TPA: hypothetical protein VK969_09450 [Acidimicrobiia bacterium]|nr:hypothetical protein [Acidimicrobiia bacterium]
MQEPDTLQDRSWKRPPLTKGQWLTVAAWSAIWTVLVFSWWSDNAAGGGWFGPGFVATVAIFGVAAGHAVLGLIALFARFVLPRQRGRWLVLVGVPVAIFVWVLGSYFANQPRYYDADTFPTGLVFEDLPEDFVRSASLSTQRGDFDVLESRSTSGELLVGTVDPGTPNTGEVVRDDTLTFYVSVAGEHTTVRRALGPVDIEVASDALSADVLMAISASARYDADWDIRD